MPEPCLDHDNNVCPIPGCNRRVFLKRAGPKSDHPDSVYLVCFNTKAHPGERKWWHFFDPNTPTTNQNLPLASSPPTSFTSAMPGIYQFTNPGDFAAPFPSKPKRRGPAESGRRCAIKDCPAQRVAILCAHNTCKKHCLRQGGCLAPGHVVVDKGDDGSTRRMGQGLPSILPSSSLLPAISDAGSLASFAAIERDYGGVSAYSAEAVRNQTEQEERDLQEALQLSLSPPSLLDELQQVMNNDHLATNNALSISLAPDLPTAGSSSSHPQSHPYRPSISSETTYTFPSQSRTASSDDDWNTRSTLLVSRPQPTQARISTQMTPSWMTPEHVQTSAIALAQKAAASRRLKNGKTKARSPPEQFDLVFWADDDTEVKIVCIDDCPEWPEWRLSTANELFTLCDSLTSVDVYSSVYKCWMQVSNNYTHKLSSNCAVIMRRRGIRCLDEKAVLERVLKEAEPEVSHFRSGLKLERKAIASSLGRRKHSAPLSSPSSSLSFDFDDDDSDVEVVSPPILKRRIKQEVPDDDMPRSQKPRLTLSIPTGTGSYLKPFIFPDSPTSSASSLSPFSPFSALPSASSSGTDISSASPTTPFIDLTRSRASATWPAGIFTVDMLAGFALIDKGDRSGKSLPSRFQDAFGVKWKKSTYHDQRKYLRAATPAQIQVLVDAGRTEKGLWSILVTAMNRST